MHSFQKARRHCQCFTRRVSVAARVAAARRQHQPAAAALHVRGHSHANAATRRLPLVGKLHYTIGWFRRVFFFATNAVICLQFSPVLCHSALVHLLEHLERIGCVRRELRVVAVNATVFNAFDRCDTATTLQVYWSLTPHALLCLHAAFGNTPPSTADESFEEFRLPDNWL